MNKTTIILFVCLLTLGLAASCGDNDDDTTAAADNTATCQNWLADMGSLTCGDAAYSGSADCQSYADVPCDMADYLSCLLNNTECNEAAGTFDTTGWMTCMDQAICVVDDGSPPENTITNVLSCEAWLESITCDENNFADTINCEVFMGYNCDLMEYFQCLNENTQCEAGTVDTSGLVVCGNLAVCGQVRR